MSSKAAAFYYKGKTVDGYPLIRYRRKDRILRQKGHMKIARSFFLTMAFFVLIFGFLTVNKSTKATAASNLTREEEMQDLDTRIQSLKEMKKGYEARAQRHEDQAEKYKHAEGEAFSAKRHKELADENKGIAQKIQKEIDQLETRKKVLLQKHG